MNIAWKTKRFETLSTQELYEVDRGRNRHH